MILVTVDTLRTDRLGCYGGQSPATPAFDRLAREGTLFENAIATNPLTLPAHVSILTGRSPGEHGVHGNGNFALADGVPTLGTILSGAGFATGAFVGAFPLAYRFGLGRGFGIYDDDFGNMEAPGRGVVPRYERRAREVNERARRWLDARRPEERFFLWVHYFDPHFEYVPEEPYASRYPGRPYDGEVAATDAALGEILADMDRLGMAASTAVVVVADHGEGLGDHGEAFHGVFLYDATIHVPLIIRAPGITRAGSRVRTSVSGADVAPTTLAILGIAGTAGMTGRSALSSMSAATVFENPGSPRVALHEGTAADAPPEPVFAEAVVSESYGPWFEFRWSPLIALRTAAWKYVEAPEPELYDLKNDPGETRNLAQAKPERLAEARKTLASARAAVAGRTVPTGPGGADGRAARPADPRAARAASAEEIERLRSLGYAATAAAPSMPLPSSRLRDPKTMRGYEEAYYRAFLLLSEGKIDDAIRAYRALLARDPNAPLVHHQLGRAFSRSKQYDAAEKEFREALRLAPDLAEAAYDIAAVRETLGDSAGAEQWFRAAIALNAIYPEAHAALARRLFAKGDLVGARSEIERAVALAPTDPAYKEALRGLDRQMAR